MKRRRNALYCTVFCLTILSLLMVVKPVGALRRTLRVGYIPNMPPYQFTGKDGQLDGLHADILKLIGEREDNAFELTAYTGRQELLRALEVGDIDIILGYPVKEFDQHDIRLTKSISTGELCMLVPMEHYESRTLPPMAVIDSDTISRTMLDKLGFNIYYSVAGQTMLFEARKEHPGTALVGLKDSLLYQLEQAHETDTYELRLNYLGTVDYCLAIRRTDLELWHNLNDSIATIKAEQAYENLCRKWIPDPDQDTHAYKIIRRGLILMIAVAAVAFIFIFIQRQIQNILKHRVAEQTEQIRTENELRNHIIKYSPSGMLLFDEEYKVTLMNHSAVAIAGLETAPIGCSALELPIFGDILRREGPLIFELGTTIDDGNYQTGSGNGERSFKYFLYQVDRHGQLGAVLLSLQDMTKAERLRQAEFEKEKNSALNRIVAGIAHEIRNPLMSIRTFASLIGPKGDDPEVQESFAAVVPQEVDRINRLIEDLIHYAKPSKRQLTFVKLSDLIREVLQFFLPVLRRGPFTLVTELDDNVCAILDRDQLRQVLLNLLFNAVDALEAAKKAGKKESELELRVTLKGDVDTAQIIIQDMGTGMSDAILQQCREPFYSSKEDGSGLGLPLCDQYVLENKGHLSIISVPEEGTTITLSFERKFHETENLHS